MKLSSVSTRVVSCVLALLLFIEMTLSSSITMAYGAENREGVNAPEAEQTEESLTEENVVETGEDYTIFEAPDGSNVIQMYPAPVRAEEEDGDLVDLDPSLRPDNGGNTYRNTCGFVDVSLPSIPSEEEPIKVKGNDREFSFYPLFHDPGADISDTGKPQGILDTEENSEETVEEPAPDEESDLSEAIPEAEDDELGDAGSQIRYLKIRDMRLKKQKNMSTGKQLKILPEQSMLQS